MRSSDRLVLASTVAVLLISFTARPLTTDSSYLGLSWFVVLVLAAATVGLRRARLTAGFVFASQLALLAVLLFVVSSFAPSRGEPWYAHYVDLWQQGLLHMQTQAAPMDPDAGVKIIFVSVIGLIFVLTDLLVSGLDRPAWGIAPPAAAFVVPALGLGIDTGIVPFACLALGYLGILVADGLNRTGRWTRGLSRDSADGFGTATPMVWRAAGLIGVPALVPTAVLGSRCRPWPCRVWGSATAPAVAALCSHGPDAGSAAQPQPGRRHRRPRYTTDKPGGLYLRMASLPQFDASGWRNVQMRLESGTKLPQIPGRSSDGSDRRTTEISVLGFGSEYLPLPYAPRDVTVTGDLGVRPETLVMLSSARVTLGKRDHAISGTSVTKLDVDPSRRYVRGPSPAPRPTPASPPSSRRTCPTTSRS